MAKPPIEDLIQPLLNSASEETRIIARALSTIVQFTADDTRVQQIIDVLGLEEDTETGAISGAPEALAPGDVSVNITHARSPDDGSILAILDIGFTINPPVAYDQVQIAFQSPYEFGVGIGGPIEYFGPFPMNFGAAQSFRIQVRAPAAPTTSAIWVIPFKAGKALTTSVEFAKTFTLTPLPVGTTIGAEFSPPVTGLTLVAPAGADPKAPNGAATESGVQTWFFSISWNEPLQSGSVHPDYGGVKIELFDNTNGRLEFTDYVLKGTTVFTSPPLPVKAVDTSYSVRLISFRTGYNKINSVQSGVTPVVAFVLRKGTGSLNATRTALSTLGPGLGLDFFDSKLRIPTQGIIESLIADAAVANYHFKRLGVDRIAIVNADILNLAAGKILAGALASGVIYTGTLSADQITAGTANVGAGGITISGGGGLTIAGGNLVVSPGDAVFNGNIRMGTVTIVTGSRACNMASYSINGAGVIDNQRNGIFNSLNVQGSLGLLGPLTISVRRGDDTGAGTISIRGGLITATSGL